MRDSGRWSVVHRLQQLDDIFDAGKYAMITNGSWMTNAMFTAKGIEIPASQRVVLVRDPQIDPPQPGSATMPPADPGELLG